MWQTRIPVRRMKCMNALKRVCVLAPKVRKKHVLGRNVFVFRMNRNESTIIWISCRNDLIMHAWQTLECGEGFFRPSDATQVFFCVIGGGLQFLFFLAFFLMNLSTAPINQTALFWWICPCILPQLVYVHSSKILGFNLRCCMVSGIVWRLQFFWHFGFLWYSWKRTCNFEKIASLYFLSGLAFAYSWLQYVC